MVFFIVFLQCDEVICALFYNLGDKRFLSVKRIQRDQGSREYPKLCV